MTSRFTRRDILKLGGALALAPAAGAAARAAGHASAPVPQQGRVQSQTALRPNIIILLLDTLSARHISLYGYARETMPNLEIFARRATIFHAHHSAGNFTTPSSASLLTGVYPWTHRALHYAGLLKRNMVSHNIFNLFNGRYHRLGFAHNLLADALLYQVAEDIDEHVRFGAFNLIDSTIFDNAFPNDALTAFRAFDQYLVEGYQPGSIYYSHLYRMQNLVEIKQAREAVGSEYPRGMPSVGSSNRSFTLEPLFDGVIELLRAQPTPFFGYIHLYPPHEPYLPRAEFVDKFQDNWRPTWKKDHFFSEGENFPHLMVQRRRYDTFIAHTDAELGRLLSALDANGLLDNSYVIVTSDHGQLFERGVHGHSTPLLYQPLIHVPLFISAPGQRERVDVLTPTSNIDLLPTLMQIAGLPVPPWAEGQLLPEFGGEPAAQRSIYSMEAKTNSAFGPLTEISVSLRKGRYKLIHYRGYEGYEDESELYDLENDPEEWQNLYKKQPAIAGEMRAEIDDKLAEVNQPYLSAS